MKIAAPLKTKGEVAISVLRQVKIRLWERGGVPCREAKNDGFLGVGHPVFMPKNAKSDAPSLFSASSGSNPRHLRPLSRMSLAPSAMA